LRREEIAQLACVSVDYYVRLEQGRHLGISDEVLDSISDALRLTPAERRHLRDLAHPPDLSGVDTAVEVHPSLLSVMGQLETIPSFVVTFALDFVAWNDVADVLYDLSNMPQSIRNTALFLFLDPRSRDLYVDWEWALYGTAGHLRLAVGERPADSRLIAVVNKLIAESPEFRAMWSEYPVSRQLNGPMRLRHPWAGRLDLSYHALSAPDEPGQLLAFYVPEATPETQQNLLRLVERAKRSRETSPAPRVKTEDAERAAPDFATTR
jgi:transcriptional regulator with XRE-family HTH domain